MKHLFALLILAIAPSVSLAGEPSLDTVLTLQVGTQQVTLYTDHDTASHTLYYMPARLVVQPAHDQTPMINVVFARGIENSPSRADKFEDVKAGRLNGGVVDAYLQLKGSIDDIDGLRKKLEEAYPQYAKYRIAMAPLKIGSASLACTNRTWKSTDSGSSLTSGGPVNEQPGGTISTRFRLSEYDAAILKASLESGKTFSSAFDTQLTARARVWIPETTIKVICNKHQAYSYVESHFKAKGGFWFWSFAADIRTIRQDLERSGDLKIEIVNSNPDLFKPEQLQAMADKWVTDFVLKDMFHQEIPLPQATANASEPGNTGWFSWASLGTSYSKVDINSVQNERLTYSWSYSGVQEFPVYANADFGNMSQDSITTVDFNKTYWTYLPLGVLPPRTDVLNSDALSSISITIKVKVPNKKESDEGATDRRSVTFSKAEQLPYRTLVPLYIKGEGSLAMNQLSGLSYSLDLASTNDNQSFAIPNQALESTNWEFDCPTIDCERLIGIRRLTVPAAIWTDYPNLRRVRAVFTTSNDQTIDLAQARGTTPAIGFFPRRSGDKEVVIKSCKIVATYKKDSAFVEETGTLPDADFTGRNVEILETSIPSILTLGGGH